MLKIPIYYRDSTTILTNSVVEFVLFSVEYSMRCFSPQQARTRPAVFLKKYGGYCTTIAALCAAADAAKAVQWIFPLGNAAIMIDGFIIP